MDKRQQQLIENLLQRYLKGECTPEEEEIIREWYDGLELSSTDKLAEDPAFAIKAEHYLRSHLPGLPGPVLSKRSLVRSPVRSPVKRIYLQWSAAAAILAAIITLSLYLTPAKRYQPVKALTVMATGSSQQKRIVLPDSSVVWLNRSSKLEWTGNFDDSIRLVRLTGEALFDISRDGGKPFIVQAGNTSTRVLGTVFNMEAYANEQEIKVALLNGKVQFLGPDKSGTLLSPGEMVTWHKKDTAYNKKDAAYNITPVTDEVAAWTKGFTVFNEVPLAEAIERLARQNNWQVIWRARDRPLQPVSALFSRETPGQILEGLAFTHHLKFTLQQDTVIIF